MNKLQCELCGSIDIIKIGEDVFQCQHCGCKYTAEQAKKILFGEVTFKAQDFEIVGGKLVKYNGADPVVSIPDTVSVVGKDSFKECSGITEVTIPDSVRIIEDCAFAGCTSLETVRIPASVTTIGWGVFESCHSLKSIVIPDSVTTMGGDVFHGCKALKNVRLSRGLERIKERTFAECSSLEEIVIPEGVRVLAYNAFDNSMSLKKLTLPSSLEKLDTSGYCHGWSRVLSTVEGNKQMLLKLWVNTNDLYSWVKNFSDFETTRPAFAVDYVREILADRRAQKRCPYCGGRLKGLFDKVCTQCNRTQD